MNGKGPRQQRETTITLNEVEGTAAIAVFNPIACALLRNPGACGADIAAGEGQPLGTPMQFGGPGLGLFA
ncbi:MAG: hypothetical protein IH857_08280, partial [Deltaproteobacteria bacterium]|nr:hypothetical protein [Deltaproteobacteria bacterium]